MLADVLPAAALGLALHQYFRRYEPYPLPAILTVLGCGVLLQAAISYFSKGKLSLSLQTVVENAAVTAATLFLSIATYRLSPWHPLARYPGPLLHRLTKLRVAYASWFGTNFRDIKAMHEKYGPVVRVGPNELSIAEVSAIQTVYSGLPKDKFYRGRRPDDGGRSLITLNGVEHAHRRKMWDRGLGHAQITSYAADGQRIAKQVLGHLNEVASKGSTVDLTSWVRLFAFDFMSVFAFGKEFGMTKAGTDEDGMIQKMTNAVVASDINSHVWWLGPRLARFPIPLLLWYYIQYFRVSRKFFHEREKRETVSYDLWHYLMDKDAPHRLTIVDLYRESAVGIIAGADTVANAAVCTLYLLIQNPECMVKARAEIEHLVNAGNEPWADIETHKSMPYLNACIDESMRVLSVVPVIGSRIVPHGSGGKVISGYYVPEGTEVFVPPIAIHTDERYFSPEPTSFHPERWIEPGWNTQREAHIPFSSGSQNCVGKNLARVEMALLLSMLIYQYDMEFAPEFDVEGFPGTMQEHIVAEVGPMYIRLKKRADLV